MCTWWFEVARGRAAKRPVREPPIWEGGWGVWLAGVAHGGDGGGEGDRSEERTMAISRGGFCAIVGFGSAFRVGLRNEREDGVDRL